MENIKDVWVNWFEGEENGYNVCEFFEWRKSDRIEMLDKVVVLKVEPSLFSIIENSLQPLPQALLADVYEQSYMRKNTQRLPLEYCFIATDGERTLTVDTLGYVTPIRKSRLVPKQEEQVIEMAGHLETRKYNLSDEKKSREYHMLSPHPSLMYGLNRKERQLKQILFMALDQLHTEASLAEVRYWLTEWAPHHYEKIQAMTFEQAWNVLYDSIATGWSEKHEEFCEAIIKGQPFFEKLWELQQDESVKNK
ncbi:DUF3603 family protein [Texcoconibacillus texcoconensis]|uniref:Uncharacterized protein n=1 Tax=Texcoconibacillus texcoconensis TaxID=1095777 RepID=A0A840QU45_9BACI|nr:DUF3603 family protein [Texcoconibacillus texcoconensis]MBB5174833.1 hypothetical protein [Texcoconibacillus texcoconensis]